jgi:hypothetical protein
MPSGEFVSGSGADTMTPAFAVCLLPSVGFDQWAVVFSCAAYGPDDAIEYVRYARYCLRTRCGQNVSTLLHYQMGQVKRFYFPIR